MTTMTCAPIGPHTFNTFTAPVLRDAGSASARPGQAPVDPDNALTGDPDRAAELADRIAALGEPWAGNFVAYIASSIGAGVHQNDDHTDVRAKLVGWLQVRRIDGVVRALLNAWPCWRPAPEPH